MVFSSLLFIFVFLPATLVLYYLAPRNLKNVVLVISSLIFYAWGEPVYILIMIYSAILDYCCGLTIERYRGNQRAARTALFVSMVGNLAALCFFKYAGFLVDNINALFGLQLQAISLPLPVGISFYTFQTMSYTIDVYLGKVPAQRNIITYATFVTMFPQLVAGPIIRYIDVAKQVEKRQESLDLFGEGAEIFILGLAKKVLIANNIGLLWDSVKALPLTQLSALSAWLGILAFTFQIYFDFSGYSDMAVGLGKMFGFDLMQNFSYPYISRSVTEFWRRWHISLGSWFREYVYIPLGGNKHGLSKQIRNILTVWFLTGLWHGASWNFVIWGLYFAVFLIVEKVFLLKWLQHKPRLLAHAYTMLIVIIGWVFFEFESLAQGLAFIRVLFGFGTNSVVDGRSLYYLSTNALLFVFAALCSTPLPHAALRRVQDAWKNSGAIVLPMALAALVTLCTAYLVNQSYNPFLYFRF